jgi:hypothetical protein
VSDQVLLDRVMPRYDAVRIERRLMMGGPAEVWEAVLDADFMRTANEMPAVRFLFGTRSLAERAMAVVRGESPTPPPPPESMRLRDLGSYGEWVRLDDYPPHEIAFGAVGRFWAGETVWEQIGADEFATFAEAGMAKIACSFSLHLCEERRTLVTYECRTLATDPSARRAFMRYWRPLSPFIGFVLRAQLRTIETTLEEAPHRGALTR